MEGGEDPGVVALSCSEAHCGSVNRRPGRTQPSSQRSSSGCGQGEVPCWRDKDAAKVYAAAHVPFFV